MQQRESHKQSPRRTDANILSKTLQRVPEDSIKIIRHDQADLISDEELVHICNLVNVINFIT